MADLRFNEGAPPNAQDVWLRGDIHTKVIILQKFYEYLRIVKTLDRILRSLNADWERSFKQIIAQATENTVGLVEYFDIDVKLSPSETINDSGQSVVSRAYDYYDDGDYLNFVKFLASELSKPDAETIFKAWNEETPLAIKINGTYEPTITVDATGLGVLVLLRSLLRKIDFKANRFNAWPEELKQVVLGNVDTEDSTMRQRMINAGKGVVSLKEQVKIT